MKSIDQAEVQARLDEILQEAQRQPILIRRQDQYVAAIVSIAEYERLRSDLVLTLLDVRSEVVRDAAAAGLTEAQVTALLKGD